MDQVVARLAGWPLDRSHPLWQVWMLEGSRGWPNRRSGEGAPLRRRRRGGQRASGLDPLGQIPTAASSHHRTPRSRVRMPRPGRPVSRAHGTCSRRVPGTWCSTPCKLPAAVWGLRGSFARRRAATAELEALKAEVEGSQARACRKQKYRPDRCWTPRTLRSIGRSPPPRAVSTAVLPLRADAGGPQCHGPSLNDVLLTLVGGALHESCTRVVSIPDRSLTASVPVSSDPPPNRAGRPDCTGNKVSNLFVSLHTELEDPLERLAAVHRSMAGAKRLHDATGPELMEVMLGIYTSQALRLGDAALFGARCGRSPSLAGECDRLQRSRPPRVVVGGGCPTGRVLLGRPGPRRHRCERNRVVLHGCDGRDGHLVCASPPRALAGHRRRCRRSSPTWPWPSMTSREASHGPAPSAGRH